MICSNSILRILESLMKKFFVLVVFGFVGFSAQPSLARTPHHCSIPSKTMVQRFNGQFTQEVKANSCAIDCPKNFRAECTEAHFFVDELIPAKCECISLVKLMPSTDVQFNQPNEVNFKTYRPSTTPEKHYDKSPSDDVDHWEKNKHPTGGERMPQ